MGTNQIHDYNPGIAPNGLFWTIPIRAGAIKVDLRKGTATLAASNLKTKDFGDFFTSIYPATNVPAWVSFRVKWFGIQTKYSVNKPGLKGDFMTTSASIEWTSRQAGFSFRSDPANTSITDAAILGHERNGLYAEGP